MRQAAVVLLSVVLAAHAQAMTHTEEAQRSSRAKAAAQEQARQDQEQRQLKLVEECDRTAQEKYRDRKQRDRYYEACVAKALGASK